MTKLRELETDLEIHIDRLAELKKPDVAAWMLKFRKIDVNLLIPSYTKIIKSIADEIKVLNSKKKSKSNKKQS